MLWSIVAVLFWGSICLFEGLVFIHFSLDIVPAIPVEQLGPISRELWKALFFWAGIAWILALPNSIIVWKLSSKPSYGILPKILLFLIIFCVLVSLIMAFIFNAITFPNEFPWRESLLLTGITYLFYIPHIFTPYILFRPLYLRYELSKIEQEIMTLNRKIVEYDSLFQMRDKIKQSIDVLLAHDPHNLSIMARQFQQLVEQMGTHEMDARKKEIEVKLNKVSDMKEELVKNFKTLENEKSELGRAIDEVNARLKYFEKIDPANYQIKLKNLRHFLQLELGEIRKLKPSGIIEELFFKKTFLEHQVNELDKKIGDVWKDISRVELEEYSLQLEKLILELETNERQIKVVDQYLAELKEKLKRLESERDRILSSQRQK
jgi:hypothetical protein